MLNAVYDHSFKKKNGSVTFVYRVYGTAQELEQFRTIQGEYFRTVSEEDLTPVWFSGKFFTGEEIPLIVTTKGTIVADTSEFDKAASLVKQAGGDLGKAMADAMAAKLTRSKPLSPPPPPAEEPLA